MANTNDRDAVRTYRQDDPVLPNSKSDVSLPPASECLDIAFAGPPILGQAVEDPNGHFPVDGPNLVSGRVRPDKSHLKPNSRRISS
jgi:hypothetical protein